LNYKKFLPMRNIYSCLLMMLFCVFSAKAQFTTVSAATSMAQGDPNATCFVLTPPLQEQKGAVWNNTPINLSSSFEFNTRMFFGATDAGADGIAFVLQQVGTSYIGRAGAGIGYGREWYDIPGPVPSFIVEFDTYFNEYGSVYDPTPLDHVGFQKNSNTSHTSITYGYVSPDQLKPAEALNANIEDNQWHDVKFTWNATTKTMTVVVTLSPGVTQTFTYTGDIVNTIFGGNPMVYWGFTGATGGGGGTIVAYNEHKVCIVSTPLPPPPPPPGDCGQLRTQTPGGWGAKPEGNNPGTYLYAHFDAAFPNGLTVGSTYTIKLEEEENVTAFLPSGGQAKKLTQNYVNPTDLKNTLAGHLVALTLSVTFDQTDPNFGAAGIHLGDMEIGSGRFKGWTVSAFLAEANKVLGGAASSYTVQQVLETASAINENYVDGKTDKGYLVCPKNQANARTILVNNNALPAQSGQFFVGPNPSNGRFTVGLPDHLNNATIIVTNASGMVIERRAGISSLNGQTLQLDLSRQAGGLYMVRIVSGGQTYTNKILVRK
jgi:hypothetical protein